MTEFEFFSQSDAKTFYGPVAKKLMDELFERFGILDGRVILGQRNADGLWLGHAVLVWDNGAVLASVGDWMLTAQQASVVALKTAVRELSELADSGELSAILEDYDAYD